MKFNFAVYIHIWYDLFIMDQLQLNVAVSELALTFGHLLRRMRVTNVSHDLSLTEHAVISRLAKDGPATISDLARAESVKPQSMGALIARMEKICLVERRPHPTDRRQVNILLTEKGTALREQIRAAKRTWLAEAIAKLGDEEQETLFKAGAIIRSMVEL
jgi:DNA-binding MarR family transcriptional regulator